MSVASPPPASLAHIAARVEARLRELIEHEYTRWTAFDPDLAAPLAEVGRLVLSGGKRLRPAFTHWGFVGAGGDPDDRQSRRRRPHDVDHSGCGPGHQHNQGHKQHASGRG